MAFSRRLSHPNLRSESLSPANTLSPSPTVRLYWRFTQRKHPRCPHQPSRHRLITPLIVIATRSPPDLLLHSDILILPPPRYARQPFYHLLVFQIFEVVYPHHQVKWAILTRTRWNKNVKMILYNWQLTTGNRPPCIVPAVAGCTLFYNTKHRPPSVAVIPTECQAVAPCELFPLVHDRDNGHQPPTARGGAYSNICYRIIAGRGQFCV